MTNGEIMVAAATLSPMTDTPERMPTIQDDEETLAAYATELGDSFAAIAHGWLLRLVESRGPGVTQTDRVVERLTVAADELVAALRALLALDIADQPLGPLELLRHGVQVPSEVLDEAGVVPAARDEFAISHFPGDTYALSPASFAEIDPQLHEPGLMWGAAKAHVHLRRRREQPVEAAVIEERVVVLSADLMDRSKISAAFPDATVVRSWSKLEQEVTDATMVVVDLGRLDDPAVLSTLRCRVVAFGSHVDDVVLAAAEAAGAEALPRSVFFRRLETGDL